MKYFNFIGPFPKKIQNLLFSENVVVGKSSSKCPGLSVRTAKHAKISRSKG